MSRRMLAAVAAGIVAAGIVAATPAGASAQAARAAAADPAREIAVVAYVADGEQAAFVDNYVRSFAAGLDADPRAAAAFKARPAARAAILAAARREANGQYPVIVLPALVELIAKAYRDGFTPDELAEVAAYYRTPQAQRLLHAFAAPDRATAVPAAQADPVVQRFLASPVGRKERASSGILAQAMAEGMVAIASKVNDAVLPKVRAALQGAMAGPGPSR